MYSTVYFRDEHEKKHVKLGIKCEHSVPEITIKDDTIILTNTCNKVHIREDNSSENWQEYFAVSFIENESKVVVKFKNTPKYFKIHTYTYSWKVDFEITECNQ